MRHLWAAAVLLALVMMGPSTGGAAEVRRETLGNGLVVLLAPDPEATAVDVAVWYRAGTRYEKPGTIGITNLLGRLMFQGSRGFPAGAHRSLLEAEGATVNSVANPDFICFFQTLPPQVLELALKLEADRMGALELTQAKLDAELAVVRDERRRRIQTNPIRRGLEELYRLAFTGHPYGYPVIGAEQDLGRITLADVETYYRERFSPQNAVVTVVGGFEPGAAMELVRRHFNGLQKRSGARPADAPLAPQREERHAVLRMAAPASFLLVGWRVPGARDPDDPALELIHHLLTGGTPSRLNRALLGPQRGFLQTQGELDRTREAALLLCMATVRQDADSAETERALVSEVEKLAQGPVEEAELERAKRRLEATLLFQAQSARSRAETMGMAELLQDSARPVMARIQRIRVLTAADVQRVAAKVLRPATRSVVWVKSPGGASVPPGPGGGQ